MSSQDVRTAPSDMLARDECSRNSVTASLSQRAQQELSESVILIPERPFSRSWIHWHNDAGLSPSKGFKRWNSSCRSIADVIEADRLTKPMTDDGVSRQAKECM
jgi:hypothetical protein